jgi:hypothetical protein
MAYGTNAPAGLVPVKKLDGSAWTGALNPYPIASTYGTSIGFGDPVTMLADGTIGIGVAGGIILGVFRGVQWTDTSGVIRNSLFWPASTATFNSANARALIIDDPNMVYTIQETNAAGTGAGTPLAAADVNLNANFRIGTVNTATGLSGTSLNNETEAVTATLNLQILGLDTYPENRVGNFANWFVRIVNHQFRGGVVGI